MKSAPCSFFSYAPQVKCCSLESLRTYSTKVLEHCGFQWGDEMVADAKN